jgi:hypothetical protein
MLLFAKIMPIIRKGNDGKKYDPDTLKESTRLVKGAWWKVRIHL